MVSDDIRPGFTKRNLAHAPGSGKREGKLGKHRESTRPRQPFIKRINPNGEWGGLRGEKLTLKVSQVVRERNAGGEAKLLEVALIVCQPGGVGIENACDPESIRR